MIIDYDHNPALTTDQKLQSLKESVQMALNELEMSNATSEQNDTDANLAKTIIEDYTGSTLAGSAQSVKSVIDGLDSAVDTLDSAVDAIADYIVEQGTSGIWTYRKWNSGIAECWGEHTAILSPYQQAFGGYAYSTSVNFPSGLFIAYPQVKYSAAISISNANYGFALTGTLTNVLSPSTVNLYAVSNINSSCSTVWMVEAKGRWK